MKEPNVGAGSNSTTLETGHTRDLGCAGQVGQRDVPNLELRVGAVTLSWGAAESRTLRNRDCRPAKATGSEVLEDHVRSI